jgi:LPS-assembly protein
MKNKIIITFLTFLSLFSGLNAEELDIKSTNIKFNKDTKITIFEGNVSAVDGKNNKIFADYAVYNKLQKSLETKGDTEIITAEGYKVFGANILFDNKKRIIYSNNKTKIVDKDGNNISLEMFNYYADKGIFFSKGNISIIDKNNNNYNFSEIYIDEIKQKMAGSDIKAFLKQENFLIHKDNQPKFFANSMSSSKDVTVFQKGIFTYCKDRGDDKCPPWTLQSKKIEHNLAEKTIYYQNAILKVYDFPIFYFPVLSHPDPTVKRRSGFLAPSLSSSTTVGSGFNVPYFWNISRDKDLTFTPKLYLNENPVILTEYRQDFKNSNLIVDTSYTQGYKKKTKKKSSGGRAHFFSQFNYNFLDEEDKKSDLEINIQKTSNDTFFKIHDIDTTLVKGDINILKNTANYTYQDNDTFLGVNISAFEDMSKTDRSRYEYLVPITFENNIFSDEKFGFLDFTSNARIRNYDVNKQTEFFVNDFDWSSKKWINKMGYENHFKSLIKTVNYKANNAPDLKVDGNNSELSGALGFFSKLALYKNDLINKNIYSLTPKMLVRYAPGHMRNIEGGRLNYSNLFNLSKVDEIDVVESGFSTALGFDFKKNKIDLVNGVGEERLSLSMGQVISERENMDIPSSTSLDQRFSDVVGESSLSINNNVKLKYNFSLDQNYKDLNYNEIGVDIDLGKTKFNIGYLEEKNHIGNQEYVKSDVDLEINDTNLLSFSSKRNLLTSSAEFYNLSYNYINDCLKAGLAYRREFYTDRDVEPTNSLMFTISIIPFAEINAPSFAK